jgi:hypothetical protein
MQSRPPRLLSHCRRFRLSPFVSAALMALASLAVCADEISPATGSAPETHATSDRAAPPSSAASSSVSASANMNPDAPAGAETFPVAAPAPLPTVTVADCPPAVLLDQAQIKGYFDSAKFAGVVTTDMPMLLSGASAFDGPPADGAAILPTDSNANGDNTRTVWEFSTKFAAGKWLTCDYQKGLVRLALRADDSARDCVADASPAHGPGNPIKIHWACH